MKTSRLTDHDAHAPFMVKIGDKVALVRPDGTADPDPESQGVIEDGTSQYQEGSGPFSNVYEIRRVDGMYFRAKDSDIVKRP